MIQINGRTVDVNYFPDGTFRLTPEVPENNAGTYEITWKYETNDEMIVLMFLTNHFHRLGYCTINLHMPYIPNARQDRVKSSHDVFTLKYFAEFINSLGFNSVTVLDPHSSVSEALFNNLSVLTPEQYINKAVSTISNGERRVVLFYPDEGAMKRYSGMISKEYAFGIKQRDWETGKIKGLDVAGNIDLIKGSDVLIIDDICSRGGTFYYSAQKLKELGAKNIYLYVTHCEKTVFDGELFKSGIIEKLFTTDSIFGEQEMKIAAARGVSDKIEVFNC